MTSIRSCCLVAVVAAACGGQDPADRFAGPTFAVGAIAPGVAPEAEAVLNIHWFPRDGGDSAATLYIDGLPAVWGEITAGVFQDPEPVAGSAIEVGLELQVPPLGLPVGRHTVELVLDGDVLAAETIDAEALTVYSLTAYGERAAPEHLFFVEGIPGTPGGPPLSVGGEAEVTIYNLMPGGDPIHGSRISHTHPGVASHVFEGLAYGQSWSGAYGATDMFWIADAPQPATFTGGMVFRGSGPVRHYVYFRDASSGNLGATTDGWFQR